MALRLLRAFNTTPNLWLGLQQEYDLWHATHELKEWRQVKAVKELATVTA
jgi:plasmid maintenance system antidote protein VapI